MATESAQAAPAQIVVDEDVDNDSGIDEPSDVSYTTSIASSVRAFRLENGRRYHAYMEGSYAYPNDELENDRLDLQHNLFLLTLDGKLSLAPIRDDPQTVLDIGTGTGLWAIEFAEAHPSAQVIGTDLSPIQPNFVPPNLSFIVDDAEQEWVFPHKFDYIHGRALLGSIQNWPALLKRCYENLKPGGWLELQDIAYPPTSDDGTLTKDAPFTKWADLMVDAAEKVRRSLTAPSRYKGMVEEAGFADVVEQRYKWPQNQWPKDKKFKELGLWTLVNILDGLQGFSLALFTRVHGWKEEEVEVLLADVRKDIKNKSIHSYWPVYCVYGKKPEAE